MSTTTPLFQTRHGSSLHCSCCGRVEITFRDVPFILEPSDIPTVRHMLAVAVADTDRAYEMWEVRARTSNGPVVMRYQKDDLCELLDLVEGSAAMLELEQMLTDVIGRAPSIARPAP